jgi:hypothetical protein
MVRKVTENLTFGLVKKAGVAGFSVPYEILVKFLYLPTQPTQSLL